MTAPDPNCPTCAGDGWYVVHEDECYETGDCNCSGVQRECECTVDRRDYLAEYPPAAPPAQEQT